MGEFNVNKSDGSLEQTAGMPSEYPATQVMLSDGVTSVEEAVDEVTPRIATGTTLAELANAIRQLTNKQKMLCVIEVLCSAQSSYTQVLRRRGGRNNSVDEIFNVGELNIGSSPIKSIEYRLSIDSQNSSYQYLAVRTDGTSQADNWTITSWTLYYQGTPIS